MPRARQAASIVRLGATLTKDLPGCLQKLAACGTFLLFSADRLT